MKSVFITTGAAFTSDLGLLESFWLELEKQYSHKSRHYHNLAHLDNLLQLLEDCKANVEDWQSLIFAVFYHDAIYKVLKSNNEEKSAEMAQERMRQINFPEARIKRCVNHILATKSHNWSDDEDSNLFMDADLSILGSDWDQYQQYTAQVRKEYSIYPDLVYKPGRKKVLTGFLERESIFKTPSFKQRFEEPARQNILREIESL